jgi:hypothetical protein
MTTATMTADDLTKLQDDYLEVAKKALLDDDELVPVLLVLTVGNGIPEDTRKILRAVGMSVAKAGGNPDAGLNVIAFPMDMSPRNLYAQLMLIPGRHGTILPRMLALLQQGGVEDPHEGVLHGFKGITGATEKTIQATFIRSILKLTSAIGYLKIDEAWTVRPELPPGATTEDAMKARKGYADSLEDEERAEEAILVMLEAHGFQRTIGVPFTRTVRNTGKVQGFGEPWIIDSRNKGEEIKGRFSNLLRPLPGEGRAA